MNAVALPIALALIAGVGVAVQAPTNAALARATGSTVSAALISFVVGAAALTAVWLATAWLTTGRTGPAMLRDAPPWAWVGGLYGAVFVSAIAFAAPRLGIASALTFAIASQLATALVIDHFGLLGIRPEPASLARLVGLALVIGGVVLMRR